MRLQALQSDPAAYGLLYEEATKLSDENWIEPLKEASNERDKWIYFARLNGKLVGMISASVIDGDAVKLGEVFVAKEARDQGIAKKVLNTLLEEVSKNPQLIRAKAKVFTSQEPAINLYKSLGFEPSETIIEHWPDGRTHETLITFKELR